MDVEKLKDECRRCVKQKPLMKKARCEVWWHLDHNPQAMLSNPQLFLDDDGRCRYFEPKEMG